MTIEELLTRIFGIAPFFVIKIFLIVLLLFHNLFSLIVLRQTKLMIKVVEARVTPTIYAISVIHLLASLFITIWALLFL